VITRIGVLHTDMSVLMHTNKGYHCFGIYKLQCSVYNSSNDYKKNIEQECGYINMTSME